MESSVVLDLIPKTDEEYALLVDKCLATIKSRQQQIDAKQSDIKSLQVETDAMIDDIMRTLRIL